MPTFAIDLDRESRTYEPGEKITCKVEITFESPVKVRCIAVRFHGFAATEWTKVKSNKGRKRIKTYAAFEEYFRTYNDLNGERGGRCMEYSYWQMKNEGVSYDNQLFLFFLLFHRT